MLDLSEAISSTKSRNCRATEGEARFALSEVCWRRAWKALRRVYDGALYVPVKDISSTSDVFRLRPDKDSPLIEGGGHRGGWWQVCWFLVEASPLSSIGAAP